MSAAAFAALSDATLLAQSRAISASDTVKEEATPAAAAAVPEEPPDEEYDCGEGRTFPFPFPPYQIQRDFMAKLWDCLEHGGIGIFESPTGTGKTLSLLNGALQWLRDHRRQMLNAAQDTQSDSQRATQREGDDGLPQWLLAAHRKRKREERAAAEAHELRRKRRARRRLAQREGRAGEHFAPAAAAGRGAGEEADALSSPTSASASGSDAPAPPPRRPCRAHRKLDLPGGLYSEDEASSAESSSVGSAEAGDAATPKIVFATRTHSQLRQLLGELRRTRWWADPAIGVVPVASRQQLCVNDAVRARAQGSADRLNDLCTSLGRLPRRQKGDKQEGEGAENGKSGKRAEKAEEAAGARCPFTDRRKMGKLADRIRARPMDIEELHAAGRKDAACPYYAAREASDFASLLAMPYAALLNEDARKSLGVDLTGNVVIVDEAHNVVDAVNSANSTELPVQALASFASAIEQYLAKQSGRLHFQNIAMLRNLAKTLRRLHEWAQQRLGAPPAAGAECAAAVQRAQLLVEAGLERVNTPMLARFLRQRRLVPRLAAISEREARESDRAACSAAQMYAAERFLVALTDAEDDNRVLLVRPSGGRPALLRVASLFAGTPFASLRKSARAIVLAGGTMSPIADVLSQLLPHSGEGGTEQQDAVATFSCGHVVAPDHVLACALAAGPGGMKMDFSFQSREAPALMAELGGTVLNFCRAAPGGMVLFFPSYAYEARVVAAWEATGVLRSVGAVKPVFRDAQGADTATVLQAYQEAVAADPLRGAVLTSVVGGKLSEGINFADDLARVVCVVGMPYPNPHDPEFVERRKVVAQRAGAAAAAALMDNMCMKAVNQCIGRAIRHKDDYAALLLLDHRYARPQARGRVAGWIAGGLRCHDTFGPCFRDLRGFFRARAPPAPAPAAGQPPHA
eukprot:TRINITY_DN11487_c0_g1_i8.p1 TRINITY_DN11487_c0_g1~~TRINITY_DN11487_c0_g1_i8.p1  ORF type:complete len:947 (+),score=302.80 TRINITY_DN11487_c0_g1_i8:93-2843(+)